MKSIFLFPIALLLLLTLPAAQSPQSLLRIDDLQVGTDRATVLAGLTQTYTLTKQNIQGLDSWTWQEKGSSRWGTLWFTAGKLAGFTERLGDYGGDAAKLSGQIYSELYLATTPSSDPTAAYLGQREAIAQITVRDEHLPNANDELLFIDVPTRHLELRLTMRQSSVQLDKITTQ